MIGEDVRRFDARRLDPPWALHPGRMHQNELRNEGAPCSLSWRSFEGTVAEPGLHQAGTRAQPNCGADGFLPWLIQQALARLFGVSSWAGSSVPRIG